MVVFFAVPFYGVHQAGIATAAQDRRYGNAVLKALAARMRESRPSPGTNAVMPSLQRIGASRFTEASPVVLWPRWLPGS